MKFFQLFFLTVFVSCFDSKSSNTTINLEDIKNRGMVTLIFENAPQKTFVSTSENSQLGGRTYFSVLASYLNDDGIKISINPKRLISDTIQISLMRSEVEINFNHLGLEDRSFLFNNGDQILVSYLEGEPSIHVLNRETKLFDYNFDSIRNERKNNNLTAFENFFRVVQFPDNAGKYSYNQLDEYHDKQLIINSKILRDELFYQFKLLDTLLAENSISENIANYYKLKLEYIDLSRRSKLQKVEKEILFSKNKVSSLEKKVFFETDVSEKLINNNQINFNEGKDLWSFQFYQEFLNHYLMNYYASKTTKSVYNYGTFGGSSFQWDIVFDSIQKRKELPQEVKNILLFKIFDKIASDLSPEIIKDYFQLFKRETTNKNHVDFFNSKYKIELHSTTKLLLSDINKNSSYFEDLLKENNGKLIYVDFWASWCAPCIKLQPYKSELKKDYSDVLFISISTDNDHNKWLSSEVFKKESQFEQHYRLTNYYLSSFVKEQHIDYIPRYILIGKSGKIVNPNAPWPDSKEIRILFDQITCDKTSIN